MINIRADGRVVACCFDLTSMTDFGNIMEMSLEETWEGYNSLKFREDFANGDYPKLCQNCLVVTGPKYLLHNQSDKIRREYKVLEMNAPAAEIEAVQSRARALTVDVRDSKKL